MATNLWYPHYIRDFKAKTGHLSLAERGAYRALMDEYWERQGPLPADDKSLCRMIGAFPDEWGEVRDAVLAFFTEVDGKLHHKRIDEEIAKAEKQHREKSERMAKARAKRWADSEQTSDQSTDQSIDQCTDQKTDQITSTPTPTPSPTHKNEETKNDSLAASPNEKNVSRGTRLADDWRPPPDYIAFALTEGFSEAEAYREADRFRDYWVSKTGQQACKRDWFATWRNWIRNARDRRRDAGKHDAPRVVDYLREVQDLPEDDPDCWREPLSNRGQRQIGR